LVAAAAAAAAAKLPPAAEVVRVVYSLERGYLSRQMCLIICLSVLEELRFKVCTVSLALFMRWGVVRVLVFLVVLMVFLPSPTMVAMVEVVAVHLVDSAA
jgi:hypothetical protein